MTQSKIKRRAIMFAVLVTLLILPFWVKKHFGHMDFIQVLFLVLSDPQGANIDWALIFSFIKTFFPFYILIFLVSRFYKKLAANNYIYITKYIKKGTKINFHVKLTRKRTLGIIFSVLALTLLNFNYQLQIFSFFKNNQKHSDLYEKYYVPPQDANLKWPQEKQNIIHLVLESMETGFSDVEVDGRQHNLIPNLKALSEQNISFKHTQDFSGALSLKGTTWTVASLLSQTSGVPLSITNLEAGFGEKSGFLPGIVGIGELLEEQGYENYFMAGSDANFGGRETYYRSHGNYKILDMKYYKEIGKLPEDYQVFWGFEDQKLFDFAKEELAYLSSKDQPFNLTVLTVDTHFTDGYTDESCINTHEEAYANAIACSDSKVSEFIQWIQTQDFYENTTIVVTGDHLSMNHDFAKGITSQPRSIYNTIINPNLRNIDPKRLEQREFATIDFFPTTLAALGVEIPGNRLGLGTNLFSDTPTLIEEMGMETLESKISQNSNYYNEKFMLLPPE